MFPHACIEVIELVVTWISGITTGAPKFSRVTVIFETRGLSSCDGVGELLGNKRFVIWYTLKFLKKTYRQTIKDIGLHQICFYQGWALDPNRSLASLPRPPTSYTRIRSRSRSLRLWHIRSVRCRQLYMSCSRAAVAPWSRFNSDNAKSPSPFLNDGRKVKQYAERQLWLFVWVHEVCTFRRN